MLDLPDDPTTESSDSVAKRLACAVPEAAGVVELAEIEGTLSADGAWDAYAALERQIAWMQARQAALLARAERALPAPERPDGRDWAEAELAPMLAISRFAAAARLDVARRLPTHPRARGLLARGEISLPHVSALLDETLGLDDERSAAVDHAVAGEAPGRTPAAFRKIVRGAVLALRTREEQAEAITERQAERFVTASYHRDGIMGTLRADLPAADLARVMSTLTAAARARASSDDGRSMDQRRADALVESVARAAEHGIELASEQRLKPAVHVVVALSTLLGLDNHSGELDGHPIPAELAVRIASDPSGTWRRVVTDDLGTLVDYGRSTYRPPPALADHVIARDRTCVWPGCNQPARRTEIDHRRRWRDFGRTAEDNLQCLCSTHHHFKEEGWQCRLLPDGSIRWVSPTGREYVRRPRPYPVDRTMRSVR